MTKSLFAIVIAALLIHAAAADDTAPAPADAATQDAPADSSETTQTDAPQAPAPDATTDAERAVDPATDDPQPGDQPDATGSESGDASKPDEEASKPDEEAPETEEEAPETEEEAPETEDTGGPLEPWQKLHEQWLSLDRQLRLIEQQFRIASLADDVDSRERRFQLRMEFEELVENEAKPLLAELRAEVVKAYKAKPNDNVQLVRLLVGFMINHARMQQEADGKEIVELLIEHQADPKYVLVDAGPAQLSPTSSEILDRLQKRFEEATGTTTAESDGKGEGDKGEGDKGEGDKGEGDGKGEGDAGADAEEPSDGKKDDDGTPKAGIDLNEDSGEKPADPDM